MVDHGVYVSSEEEYLRGRDDAVPEDDLSCYFHRYSKNIYLVKYKFGRRARSTIFAVLNVPLPLSLVLFLEDL